MEWHVCSINQQNNTEQTCYKEYADEMVLQRMVREEC